MKAQVIRNFGTPEVFKAEDVPKPEAKPGCVIVRVTATSVNHIDCKIRRGDAKGITPEFPAILHGDVVGVVEEVGEGVTRFKVGEEVYGYAGGLKGLGGALAEYMLADARLLARKPKNFSARESAALPLVAITAWVALFEKANLQANQNVLIHGGVGGTGHIALQMARNAGAKVYTTVGSPEDFALAQEFGANEVINYHEEKPADYVQRLTEGKGFSVIFDTVGGKNLEASFAAASLNGIIATTVAKSTFDLTLLHQKGLSLHLVFTQIPLIYDINRESYGKILEKIAHMVDEDKLRPIIHSETFLFEEVAKAHEILESRKAKGKVVLIQKA